MPDFQPHLMDQFVCRQQVQELKALLDSSADLGEPVFQGQIVPSLIVPPGAKQHGWGSRQVAPIADSATW